MPALPRAGRQQEPNVLELIAPPSVVVNSSRTVTGSPCLRLPGSFP